MNAKRIAAAVTIAGATTLGFATPASAQPVVTGGLVNVTLVDVVDVNNNNINVQVPIGVAANVCNVSVALVFAAAANDDAVCTAFNNQLPVAFQAQ